MVLEQLHSLHTEPAVCEMQNSEELEKKNFKWIHITNANPRCSGMPYSQLMPSLSRMWFLSWWRASKGLWMIMCYSLQQGSWPLHNLNIAVLHHSTLKKPPLWSMEDKIKTQATGTDYSIELEQTKIMDVHGLSNNGSPIRQEWLTYTPCTGDPGDIA